MYYNFISLQKKNHYTKNHLCIFDNLIFFYNFTIPYHQLFEHYVFYPNIKYSYVGVPGTLLFVPLRNFYGHLTHFVSFGHLSNMPKTKVPEEETVYVCSRIISSYVGFLKL